MEVKDTPKTIIRILKIPLQDGNFLSEYRRGCCAYPGFHEYRLKSVRLPLSGRFVVLTFTLGLHTRTHGRVYTPLNYGTPLRESSSRSRSLFMGRRKGSPSMKTPMTHVKGHLDLGTTSRLWSHYVGKSPHREEGTESKKR